MFENLMVNIRYRLHWETFVPLLNSNIARFALLIPIFGYLIFFNDEVTNYLNFTEIRESCSELYFDKLERLQFPYFGMVAIAFANFGYLVIRPAVMREGETEAKYVSFGLTHFNFRDFEICHLNIRSASPVSAYGVYSDTVWNAFHADGSTEGVIKIHQKNNRSGSKKIPIDWNDARRRHEDLLVGVLKETYRRKGKARAFVGVILSAIAIGGFVLLLAPAVDLFIAISQSAFSLGPCLPTEPA